MEKVMGFLREKFYFVIGGFILFLILLIVVFSCSLNNESSDYETMEKKLIEAAKEYMNANEKELPTTDETTVTLNSSQLISEKYLKNLKDPESGEECSGTVTIVKRENIYKYSPTLTCSNYKTKYLNDSIKESLKLDSIGNGLYVMNNEYVFRGENVKNYISFNNELWRVIKIDKDGYVEVVKNDPDGDDYEWDDRYNTSTEGRDGINDFLLSRLRTSLNSYYKKHFNEVEGAKASIVKHEFCIGARKANDDIKGTAECSKKTTLYVGLINTSEYYRASLDKNCTKFGQKQCANYNYLATNDNTGWTLTAKKDESSKVYSYYSTEVESIDASNSLTIYPVIYLDNKMITTSGTGTKADPFILK